AGIELEVGAIRSLHGLAMTRVGFDPVVDLVLARVLVDLFRISPDPKLSSSAARSLARNVDEDYEERILPLVRAVAKSAPSVEHRYLLARALLSVGEAREALQVSEDVLARGDLSPADTSELRQRRGSLYWHRGDFQAALRERQASYEASPSPNRLVELANAFNAAGQPERALESLRQVLREIPWRSGEQLFGAHRLFRVAVEALWHCGGRERDAVLMRDTLVQLLEHHRDGLGWIELWQVRAALLQLETLKTEAG
ncbi:MAG TPA: hypothetical protein DEA08_12970, partial [Planctomycetes bacterium]|nr:hypothetical protein [Planctomycetota bacterium]